MKLSLAWIFDHIVGVSWKDVDIKNLVSQFNLTTAEIDGLEKVSLDVAQFFLIRVTDKTDSAVVGYCAELDKEFTLPMRDDVVPGQLYMIKKVEKDSSVWATLEDWYGTKEGLLPAFACSDKKTAGQWKQDFEIEDYILEIDNTSITHRPDMWGHRGVAREMAAILDLPLRAEEQLVSDIAVRQYEDFAAATGKHPFSIELKAPQACSRFAALHVPKITQTPSFLPMAWRLARVDARPIDGIVDTTNYVMLDLSQPMHAFDAQQLPEQKIGPRMARSGETLTLLDGETVSLSAEDLVISDGKNPIALAGVMGGERTKVTSETTSLLLEAAWFNPVTVRKTATRLKKRTDSSTRFEKNLDPNQNITALKRFVALLLENEVPFEVSEEIASLGAVIQPSTVVVSHGLIERALGVTITPEFITKTLEVLGMTIEYSEGDYTVQVPTYRSTKDIQIPEDLVEEVGRFYGYENIPVSLPKLELKAHSLEPIHRRRQAEQILAHCMSAREVHNYPLYDELYLQKIGFEPQHCAKLANPVSENAQRLVTSLVPHLLKSVELNKNSSNPVRFFEWGRIWKKEGSAVQERKLLSGILVDQKPLNFYDAKQYLQELFDGLKLTVAWQKVDEAKPWSHPHQTAQLVCEQQVLGYAGKLHPKYLELISWNDGFVFELDSSQLLRSVPSQVLFKPLSKYQESKFDVSMFVPRTVTVSSLEEVVKNADDRIVKVMLTDFFQKEDWPDRRAVTLRYVIRDQHKTPTKEELDEVCSQVIQNLTKKGVTIR